MENTIEKFWIAVDDVKKYHEDLRIDVKCYLEDELELDAKIVNKVKEIFAKHYTKLLGDE